ncbi:MAG: type II secretion system protein [Planctomycetota bacterium]
MTTYQPTRKNPRTGFTLVELLVAITVIGILAAMLSVAVGRVLTRGREFAIQIEMQQLESAIEKFKIDHGFYPPSFKNFTTAADVVPYINRIAPSNAESQLLPAETIVINGVQIDRPEETRLQRWWDIVGVNLALAANRDPQTEPDTRPGSDLVFWLNGLSKNRQFPLTHPDGRILAAHNYAVGGDGVERQVYFEFAMERVKFEPAFEMIANYIQAGGAELPYLYRDAASYHPTAPQMDGSGDGAYVFAGVTKQQVIDAAYHTNNSLSASSDVTSAPNPDAASIAIFNTIYPNPDSFQLISFGLDGMSGGPTTCPEPAPANPNSIDRTCAEGADNMVNFGREGMTRLDNVVLDSL